MLDCVVIGAGAAGIAAARRLARGHASIALIEAGPQPGGRVRTASLHGFRIEHGAAFVTSFYTRTLALAAEAGVPLEAPGFHPGRYADMQALAIDGALYPHDIGTLRGYLRFPHVPLRQKIATGLRILGDAAGGRLHVADPAALARVDDEGALVWGARALGVEASEFFLRTAFEPFFFYEAADASAAFVRALLAHALRWRLLAPRDGMGTLLAALAHGLPAAYDDRVLSIGLDGGGYRVESQHRSLRARAVIVACPPPAIRAMALPLDQADRGAVEQVVMAPSVRVNLGYASRQVLAPPAVTPAGPGHRPIVGIGALSPWMPGRPSPTCEIVRVSFSAWRSAELMDTDERSTVAAALADCATLGIALPAPDWVSVIATPHAIVRTPPGHFRHAVRFAQRARGRLYFAGDWLSGSTLEGAIRSGEAAAERVVSSLDREA